jgi:Tfp pilus assembly protein PilF
MPKLEDLQAMALRSKKPLPSYGLAMEYRNLNRLDEAITTFERVHQLDPNYPPAYFMRAQVHAERNEVDSAKAALVVGMKAAQLVGDDHAYGEMDSLLQSLSSP